MTDLLSLIGGLLLTLFIYSYLVGDNPLYRIAIHLLVGVSAGYAGVVAVNRIVAPVLSQLLSDPTSPENTLWLIPIILSVLLLLKWFRPLSWLGNTSTGILVTIGAAVALVGAIAGTVIPQVLAQSAGGPVVTLVVALLAACALLYFQFTITSGQAEDAALPAWRRSLSTIGQFVIIVALGASFAGVFTTSLILLIDRVSYFLTGVTSLLGVILL